jgi:hypothetical protein
MERLIDRLRVMASTVKALSLDADAASRGVGLLRR